LYPDELYRTPRSWAEAALPNLIHYNKLDKGGHFAAWEQPQSLSEELRVAFRSCATDGHLSKEGGHSTSVCPSLARAHGGLGQTAEGCGDEVWQRFSTLRQGKVGMRVDPGYQPFLDSLLKSLAGENKGLVR